jgi:hypothetical protein
MNPLKSEPTAISGAIMALIYILAAFGLPLSPEQQTVLQANLPVVLPMIGILVAVIRQLVFAPDTVENIEEAAFRDGVAAASNEIRPSWVEGAPVGMVAPDPISRTSTGV